MPRYIDADALKTYLNEREYADMYYIEAVFGIIDRQPTISPDEVRGVGKWINREDRYWDWNIWECSACHEEFCIEEGTPKDNEYGYCPNCGAKMEVSEDA